MLKIIFFPVFYTQLFSPWVIGTRQLLMASETIPQSCTRVDGYSKIKVGQCEWD